MLGARMTKMQREINTTREISVEMRLLENKLERSVLHYGKGFVYIFVNVLRLRLNSK